MTRQPWNMTNVKAAPQMVVRRQCTRCCKCIDTSRSSHAAATGSTCRMSSFAMLMYDAMHHNCKMHVSIHVEIVQHHVVNVEL